MNNPAIANYYLKTGRLTALLIVLLIIFSCVNKKNKQVQNSYAEEILDWRKKRLESLTAPDG